MKRDFVLCGAIAALLGTTPLAAGTIQQDFDTAQALLDAGKAGAARDAFSALLGRFQPTSQSLSANLVRARLGNALLATGDAEAATPLLMAAVAGLKDKAAPGGEERGVALYDLGRAHDARGHIDSAAKVYAEAVAAAVFPSNSAADIGLRAALARSLIWSQPAEARRLLDGLLALPAASFGEARDSRALLQTLRGRVELNNGDPAEARRWFTLAAQTAGGAETQSVSLADVRIRGDLALANFRLGRMDEVQKATAYSGAGSLVSEGLRGAVAMPLPACAPLTGLAPDAVAVVEFSLGSDGRVSGVTPVYASRGSSPASAADAGPESLFAQAVLQWVWRTDDAAQLNAFWRQAVRVELRCFTDRPDADPVMASFRTESERWQQAQGLQPLPPLPDNDAAALPMIRAELERRKAIPGAAPMQQLVPLRALVANTAAPNKDRTAAISAYVALLATVEAPASVRDLARISEIRWMAIAGATAQSAGRTMQRLLTALRAEQDSSGRGRSRVAMATRLALAEAYLETDSLAAARGEFEAIVAATPDGLPDGDPIRIKALLNLSNLAAASRDSETAAKALAATGLAPEQCALVDVKPLPINTSIGSSAFPAEALRWNSGGFTRVGYDITADGQPTNVRTVVASPPFIFGPATEKAVARFRFQPVFRPGNSVGCTGSSHRVLFRVR